MKRKKTWLSILTIILLLYFTSYNVLAENEADIFIEQDECIVNMDSMANNYESEEGDIVISSERADVSQEVQAMDFDENITVEEMQDIEEEVIEEFDADTGRLVEGSLSDYLSGTGDYNLYPVNLSKGDYLQAKLNVPNDLSIDYDLIIYDSNFSVIKYSDYITAVNTNGVLAESIGYEATYETTVYIGVMSSSGGGNSYPYTLEYAISAPNYDSNEPNENAHEAVLLTLGKTGATTTKIINSSIDNDWYKFTVLDDPSYSKMRFQISSSSSVNGCRIEVYNNLVPNATGYAMNFVLSGTGGEVKLSPGEYYLRVVSDNDSSAFDVNSIPEYSLKVTPVATPTEIKINRIEDYHGHSNEVEYKQGKLVRIEKVSNGSTLIRVYGRATYYSNETGVTGAGNVIVNATVTNRDVADAGYPNPTSLGSAITDESGYFTITIYLNKGIGHNVCGVSGGFIHFYDLMNLRVQVYQEDAIGASQSFYYYIHS